MKKTLTIALLVVMVVMALSTVVNATTSAELADKLYEKGKAYGITEADKVRLERYLAENPVTDAEADQLLAKADEAIAVMENAGVENYDDLTIADKDKVKSIATEAAKIVDVQLVFGTKSVKIMKNGKVIETVTNNNGKLAYTGNSVNVVLVVSSIAVIALAVAVIAKKKIANA